MTRRIGIYSGTFDPIHNGHIAFALSALDVCQLDEVVFTPEANPRGKELVTNITHRTAMATHATKPHTRLRVARLSSSRFTITETLPELQRLFPNADISLLIGSDVARTLPYRWEGLERLAGMQFVIGLRHDDDAETIGAIVRPVLANHGINFILLQNQSATAHVASSTIRSGDSSNLPDEIAAYVRQNNLYTTEF